jgi:hypothetical protein
MVVNFKVYEISQGMRKLTQTLMLIKKILKFDKAIKSIPLNIYTLYAITRRKVRIN